MLYFKKSGFDLTNYFLLSNFPGCFAQRRPITTACFTPMTVAPDGMDGG